MERLQGPKQESGLMDGVMTVSPPKPLFLHCETLTVQTPALLKANHICMLNGRLNTIVNRKHLLTSVFVGALLQHDKKCQSCNP